jgi:hypothetical protein
MGCSGASFVVPGCHALAYATIMAAMGVKRGNTTARAPQPPPLRAAIVCSIKAAVPTSSVAAACARRMTHAEGQMQWPPIDTPDNTGDIRGRTGLLQQCWMLTTAIHATKQKKHGVGCLSRAQTTRSWPFDSTRQTVIVRDARYAAYNNVQEP